VDRSGADNGKGGGWRSQARKVQTHLCGHTVLYAFICIVLDALVDLNGAHHCRECDLRQCRLSEGLLHADGIYI
jgi:hypothetical protein